MPLLRNFAVSLVASALAALVERLVTGAVNWWIPVVCAAVVLAVLYAIEGRRSGLRRARPPTADEVELEKIRLEHRKWFWGWMGPTLMVFGFFAMVFLLVMMIPIVASIIR